MPPTAIPAAVPVQPIAVAQPVYMASTTVTALDQLDTSITSTGSRKKLKASRRRMSVSLAIGLLLAAIAVSAAVIFKFRTVDGVVAIEVNEPNPDIFVDGNRVIVTWNNGGNASRDHPASWFTPY